MFTYLVMAYGRDRQDVQYEFSKEFKHACQFHAGDMLTFGEYDHEFTIESIVWRDGSNAAFIVLKDFHFDGNADGLPFDCCQPVMLEEPF